MATKVKKAKQELEETRLAEREIVEALIGNYRTALKNIDRPKPVPRPRGPGLYAVDSYIDRDLRRDRPHRRLRARQGPDPRR
ncbi:hypothetical protein [Streptomyces goshikiensis]|uniref:hypothetical protein n=1 Tax=Streptomyces goshikiensis TaxID=1942 RepID=UPI00364D6108